MRVLLSLTFYRPNLSGLTIYVERLATALTGRGHEVTVLTSRHDASLPRTTVGEDGIRIVRVPVAFWVGKGVVMPTFGHAATQLVHSHDVVSFHAPQFEAPSLAFRARLLRRPAVMTYHCDLRLPTGLGNRVVDRVVMGSNFAAASLASKIVAYTSDYASSVGLLRRFEEKLEIVPPPVVVEPMTAASIDAFRRRYRLPATRADRPPTIGMAARLAAEKGVDVLIEALPALRRRFPEIQVLFAGPHQGIVGEEAYAARLAPAINALGDRFRFLGSLDPAEMAAFFDSIDCLVVPSVNSTESFGLVQVEAMLCGTPVVASALPGVREVVRTTGMGETVAPRDSAALSEAVERVLADPQRYARPRREIERRYDLSVTVRRYEEIFDECVRRRGRLAVAEARR